MPVTQAQKTSMLSQADALQASISALVVDGVSQLIGDSWITTHSLAAPRIDAIAYLGAGVLLCATRGGGSGSGRVFRSTDHGLSWSDQGQISVYELLCVCVAGSNIVLVSGFNGHIFRSTDNGLTFPTWPRPSTNRVYGLATAASGAIIAASQDGKVYRSTDQGATWSAGITVDAAGLYRLQCTDAGIVLVNAFSGKIYRSDDEGLTWSQSFAGDGTPMYAWEYCGSGVCLAASGAGKVYRSADNGLTWTLVFTTSAGDSADDMVFLGDERIILSTYTGAKKLYLSDDNGATWAENGTLPSPLAVLDHAIYVSDGAERYGIGGTTDGRIVRTEGT